MLYFICHTDPVRRTERLRGTRKCEKIKRFSTVFSLGFKHRPKGGLPWHFDERRFLFAPLLKRSADDNFSDDRYCVKKVPLMSAALF